MSIFSGGKSTLLEDELIDTNETASVTTWNIWGGFNFTSHHNDGSLDVLDMEIVL